MRRRRVCEKLALVPGKLDHATVAAYSVANRKKALQAYSGKYRLHVSLTFFLVLSERRKSQKVATLNGKKTRQSLFTF